MNLKLFVAAAVAAASVTACAKAPEAIAPSYVSEIPYQTYSCVQLGQERARLEQAYATTAKAQNDARTGDAWGVFLVGMPVSTLSGGNVAAEVASIKGQIAAVDKTIITKNCKPLPNPAPAS